VLDRGNAGGQNSALASRQGQLFLLGRPLVVLAPDLSDACPGGLGVHLTLDLAEQARFGLGVEWLDSIDYSVYPRQADSFYAGLRRSREDYDARGFATVLLALIHYAAGQPGSLGASVCFAAGMRHMSFLRWRRSRPPLAEQHCAHSAQNLRSAPPRTECA
jgi:hypothetical protein